MNLNALAQFAIFLVVLMLLAKPLGEYLGKVLERDTTPLDRVVGPIERGLYGLAGITGNNRMDWKAYAFAVLLFNFMGILVVFLLQKFQAVLPMNPQGLPAVPTALAWNTAVSFVTNTNWQAYSGETTLSHFTQMAGLTVQNFLSAATAMGVMAAFARGIRRRKATNLGSFWVDVTRCTLYVLLPLAVVFALFLVSQGVVQTFGANPVAKLLSPITGADGKTVLQQVLAVGPAASQAAIKMLGTNGGGFFNANAAHPFENPTPLSNFTQILSMLLIPAAFCHAFGKLMRDRRQGWALLSAMTIIFVLALGVCHWAESQNNQAFHNLPVTQSASTLAGQ